MAWLIALRPNDDRGREILDDLEKQTEMGPVPETFYDGTRRYYLSAEDAGVNAFDPMLDKIDSDWREHLTNVSGQRGDGRSEFLGGRVR
jgi:hypothetical protein